MSSNFTSLPANAWREVQILPGAAQILGMIHNTHPVQLVHGHLDVVGVGPEIIGRHTFGPLAEIQDTENSFKVTARRSHRLSLSHSSRRMWLMMDA